VAGLSNRSGKEDHSTIQVLVKAVHVLFGRLTVYILWIRKGHLVVPLRGLMSNHQVPATSIIRRSFHVDMLISVSSYFRRIHSNRESQ